MVALIIVAYLVQRIRTIVITEGGICTTLQKEPNHVRMTAVRCSMERSGPARSLRGRTRAALEEKRAHGEMSATAPVVLRQSAEIRISLCMFDQAQHTVEIKEACKAYTGI